MSLTAPIRVLVLTQDAQVRTRVTAALSAAEFQVSANPAASQPADDWQVLVTDQASRPSFNHPLPDERNLGIVGLGDVPGALARLPADFTERELRLAVQLVAQLAELRAERNQLAAAHSTIQQLAETDPLSGLPNRRAWERRASALLAGAARSGQAAWLALADLDGFKQVNERLGMSGGDRVLAESAQAMAAVLRRDDLVARLGGDEFGILLVGVAEDRVPEVLQRLLNSVAAGGFVTASIGLVAAEANATPSQLLAAAEIAMRAAKQSGGNCVVRSN